MVKLLMWDLYICDSLGWGGGGRSVWLVISVIEKGESLCGCICWSGNACPLRRRRELV